MRDLLFKNITSPNRHRKILASSEVLDQRGVHSEIRRHFIYLVKEVKTKAGQKPLPAVFILKERNTKENRERFFCKIKGSVYAVSGKRLFLIFFMHTLKITLSRIMQPVER